MLYAKTVQNDNTTSQYVTNTLQNSNNPLIREYIDYSTNTTLTSETRIKVIFWDS